MDLLIYASMNSTPDLYVEALFPNESLICAGYRESQATQNIRWVSPASVVDSLMHIVMGINTQRTDTS